MADSSLTLRPFLWACSILLLVSSALAGGSAQEFRPATAGYHYSFPSDHGAHEAFRTEWWYYTGQLTAKNGRQFGYQLTFFRRGMPHNQVKTHPSRWTISQLYLAHFAVSDLTNQRFQYAEKISRAGLGKAGAEPDRLHVWIDQWSADSPTDHAGVHRLQAANGAMEIRLSLSPDKPPVIHGREGISRKGSAEGQASHYYSFTRLTTTGRLTIGGEPFDVTGTSWMDHEFGSADLDEKLVGWDWFSVQLDDRSELMLYRLRYADETAAPASSGTLIAADGGTHHLTADTFSLAPVTFWDSPASKAHYPQRWRLTIPSSGLALDLAPLLDNQELKTGGSTQVTYWEGAIEAIGSIHGQPVRGRGYMELTGYAERLSQKL